MRCNTINNFVAVSVGDVSNASNQYFRCDGVVNKTIFNNLLMCQVIFIQMLMRIVIMLILLLMVN